MTFVDLDRHAAIAAVTRTMSMVSVRYRTEHGRLVLTVVFFNHRALQNTMCAGTFARKVSPTNSMII